MRRLRVRRPSHATVVAYLALFVAVGGTTSAAAATGGVFLLGSENRSDRASVLINRGGTPLALRAGDGKAPLRVNSAKKVRHLNADMLDRLDSTAFLPATGKAADADLLDGMDSSSFLPARCEPAPTDVVLGLQGCTKIVKLTEPIRQVIPGFVPERPGALVLCPDGLQAISGGYSLAGPADRLDLVRESYPWSVRYGIPGWYVGIVPNPANNGVVNGGTAWAVCSS